MEANKDIKDHILNHLSCEQGTDITNPVLMEWLSASESNRKEFNLYLKIWKESRYYMKTNQFNTEAAWTRINTINKRKEEARQRSNRILFTLSGIAASFLLILTFYFTGVFNHNKTITVGMTADYGNRSEITLPDGSVVKLNSGSDITYTYNSKRKTREISFQGEAFFEVSQSNDPFIVRMSDELELIVHGTSFNLRAYADDPTIQASLVEGSVELACENNNIQMKPGEIVIFDKENNILEHTHGIIPHTYGWVENKLYMDDMSLSDVCKNLERWYNVNITFEKEFGDEINYNGVLQEETITDVLDALSRLSKIKYYVKGKNIRITSK